MNIFVTKWKRTIKKKRIAFNAQHLRARMSSKPLRITQLRDLHVRQRSWSWLTTFPPSICDLSKRRFKKNIYIYTNRTYTIPFNTFWRKQQIHKRRSRFHYGEQAKHHHWSRCQPRENRSTFTRHEQKKKGWSECLFFIFVQRFIAHTHVCLIDWRISFRLLISTMRLPFVLFSSDISQGGGGRTQFLLNNQQKYVDCCIGEATALDIDAEQTLSTHVIVLFRIEEYELSEYRIAIEKRKNLSWTQSTESSLFPFFSSRFPPPTQQRSHIPTVP